VVVGTHSPAVVGEVDDGAQGVEGEVASGFVGARQADEPVASVVVLGNPEAGPVVLEEQKVAVVDVLADPVFADLLGATAFEVVLDFDKSGLLGGGSRLSRAGGAEGRAALPSG